MVLPCRYSNTAWWLSVTRYLIQACSSKLNDCTSVDEYIHTCAVLCGLHTYEMIRPAHLTIHMFQQATDLWVPTIAKFFRDLYTWSYAYWWIYRVTYKLKLYKTIHIWSFETLPFTRSLGLNPYTNIGVHKGCESLFLVYMGSKITL